MHMCLSSSFLTRIPCFAFTLKIWTLSLDYRNKTVAQKKKESRAFNSDIEVFFSKRSILNLSIFMLFTMNICPKKAQKRHYLFSSKPKTHVWSSLLNTKKNWMESSLAANIDQFTSGWKTKPWKISQWLKDLLAPARASYCDWEIPRTYAPSFTRTKKSRRGQSPCLSFILITKPE